MYKFVYLLAVATLFASLNSADLSFTKIGNKNYYVDTLNMTNWYLAYQFCRRNDLQLLTIPSEKDFRDIVTYLKTLSLTLSVWTSGTDNGEEGSWVWMSTGEPIKYFNWQKNQPDSRWVTENCLVLANDGTFQYNDANCTLNLHYICEEKTN